MAEDQKIIRYDKPVGTLAELEKAGHLDPAEYFTCGPENKNEGIVGCPMYKRCLLRGGKVHDYDFGAEKIRGVSGPQNFGVQELANKSTGRKTIHTIRPCYHLPDLEARAEASRHVKERGFFIRIIMREGQTMQFNTHGPVDEDVPGQGKRRIYQRRKEGYPVLIPKHPHIEDNPDLGGDLFMAGEAARFFAEKGSESVGEFFGQVTTEAKEKPDAEQGSPASGKRATRG